MNVFFDILLCMRDISLLHFDTIIIEWDLNYYYRKNITIKPLLPTYTNNKDTKNSDYQPVTETSETLNTHFYQTWYWSLMSTVW